jgi:serine/threonine protein kinase
VLFSQVVVIKVMHQQYGECALQEARLLRFLNAKDLHGASHIVQLRSVFEFQGHVCLVMERMYGSLLDYLGVEASVRRPKEVRLYRTYVHLCFWFVSFWLY